MGTGCLACLGNICCSSKILAHWVSTVLSLVSVWRAVLRKCWALHAVSVIGLIGEFCFLGQQVVSCSPLLWQVREQEPVLLSSRLVRHLVWITKLHGVWDKTVLWPSYTLPYRNVLSLVLSPGPGSITIAWSLQGFICTGSWRSSPGSHSYNTGTLPTESPSTTVTSMQVDSLNTKEFFCCCFAFVHWFFN